MTEEEFKNVISIFGFDCIETEYKFMVNLNTRYNKTVRFIEFHKVDGTWAFDTTMKGQVDVYYIKPVMSIDGYVLDYTIDEYREYKRFSKAHKFQRFLEEQMQLLKEMKSKIKETELSWDFDDDE